MLGVLANDDATVKNGSGAPVQHPPIEFTTRATRLRMVNVGMIIDVLTTGHQVKTVEGTLCAFSRKGLLNVVAHQRTAKRNIMGGETTIRLLLDIKPANMKGLRALLSHLVMLDGTILICDYLSHRIGEIACFCQRDVTFNDSYLAILFRYDQIARLHQCFVAISRRYKQDVNRRRYNDVCGHVHIGAVT